MDELLVELYSKNDCHLCDVAKGVLLRVRSRHPFRFAEVKIQPGTGEYEEFKERVPVVFVDKKFAFQYRVSEAEFLNILKERVSQRATG
jgi:predicted DCC family thiol-disulfide oxidoreductase YuxK